MDGKRDQFLWKTSIQRIIDKNGCLSIQMSLSLKKINLHHKKLMACRTVQGVDRVMRAHA